MNIFFLGNLQFDEERFAEIYSINSEIDINVPFATAHFEGTVTARENLINVRKSLTYRDGNQEPETMDFQLRMRKRRFGSRAGYTLNG